MISDENNYICQRSFILYAVIGSLFGYIFEFFSPSVASFNNFMVKKLMCCFSPGSM